MRALLVAGVAVLMVLAGCTAAPAGRPDPRALRGEGGQHGFLNGTIEAIAAVAPQVLVSPEGHRMAEYMVARNPLDADHLILAAHDYDAGTGTLTCVLFVTRDGGLTWKQSQPIPGLDRPHLQFDGWVSFDRQGVAHYICLDTAGTQGQTWPYYSHSTDGGDTWAPAVLIPTQTEGQSIDKSALIAASDGTVYAAFSGQVARTLDSGKTWTKGASHGSGSNPNGFAEDIWGTVYLLLRGGGASRVARTSDGGESWNMTEVGPFIIPPGYNDQNRWVDQRPWTTLPSMAYHDRTDSLFVVQQSWNTTTSLYEIHLYRSADRGVSFQELAVPAFASPTCGPCHVTKPSIAFDLEGRLGLLVQLTNDGGHTKEVWFSASGDEGLTWVPSFVLSKTAPPDEWMNARAFTPSTSAPTGFAAGVAENPTDAGPMAVGLALTTAVQELQMRWNGEYWGIEASTRGFVAPWIDHSADGAPQLYARLLRAE